MKREEKNKWYKKEFEDIHKKIKSKTKISLYDFLRIRNFKLNSLTTETEAHIREITERAFKLANKKKIKEAIQELLKLRGVRVPIASTILAMKFPKRYAIIDKRVLTQLEKKNTQLKKKEWLKDYEYNPKTYEEYLRYIRKEAKKANMPLREYERSLFEKTN